MVTIVVGVHTSSRLTVSKFGTWAKAALVEAVRVKFIVHDDILLSDSAMRRNFDNDSHIPPLPRNIAVPGVRMPRSEDRYTYGHTNLHLRVQHAEQVLLVPSIPPSVPYEQ